MCRKAVSEATKWQIIGMKDSSMISNREIARRLKVSGNCVRNTPKTLKAPGGTQRHAGSEKLKKKITERKNSLIFRQVRANPRLICREHI